MWPFKTPEIHRTALDALATELLDRLSAVEKVAKRLCDDVEELDQNYSRLRGMVYAKKLHKQTPEGGGEREQTTDGQQVVDTSKMSRAELKAHLTRSGRFIPGQPPKHQE
jgi:hypothetical protein